jgi:hypothetical protein
MHTYDAQLRLTSDPRAPGHVTARRSMKPVILGHIQYRRFVVIQGATSSSVGGRGMP